MYQQLHSNIADDSYVVAVLGSNLLSFRVDDDMGDNVTLLNNGEETDYGSIVPLRKDGQKIAPPAHHLTLVEIVMLNMTYLGLNMMLLLISIQILPAQVEVIVGSQYKGIVLGATIALGSVFTFIIGPLVGMKSDRLTGKYGRRRPIIVLSVVILCASCLTMVAIAPVINAHTGYNGTNSSQCIQPNLVRRRCLESRPFMEILEYQNQSQPNIPNNSKAIIALYVPLYLIVIISYVTTITPYNALVADKAHPDQRGLSSGAMAGMILLGNIVGAALGLLITPIGALSTVSVGLAILIITVIITVTQTSEIPVTIVSPSITCRERMRLFWLPLKDHDFRWLFITRFFLQMGLTSVIGFLEYWLKDMIQLPLCWSTYKGVSSLLLPLLVSAAISSVISGIISDKINKRKMILIVTSVCMAVAVAIMGVLTGPSAYYVTVCLAIAFGCALGGYQAVDFALLLDIIPSDKDKSLMIAVWHQAMILPQAIAVPIAGVIVDLFEKVNCQIGLGYIILMMLIAVYFILGGCFINKIRSVN